MFGAAGLHHYCKALVFNFPCIKSHLRGKISQERLNNVMMLNTYKERIYKRD